MDPINPDGFHNFEVDVSALPRFEEVEYSALSSRYLIKLQIISLLSGLFFLAAAGIAYFLVPDIRTYIWYFWILLVILLFFSWFRNFKYMEKSGYALRERDIIFKRGYLHERTTVIPFNRIQHVTLERSFLDKILSLATLKVFTAGGSGSDISIPGISPGVAAALKKALSERILGHV